MTIATLKNRRASSSSSFAQMAQAVTAPRPAPRPAPSAQATAPRKVKPATRANIANVQTRIAKKGQQIYAVVEHARPAFGHALFAHTHAALHVLGLLQASRPSVSEGTLTSMIGARAVKYHIGKENFEQDGANIRLTTEGLDRFTQRAADGKLDNEMTDQFIDLFLEGKTGTTGVNKSFILTLQR